MAFYIQSVHSGLYLDIEESLHEPGTGVILFNFNGKKNQQWKYMRGSILSKMNGLVLGVDDTGKKIVMSVPDESGKQKWHFDDDFTIRNDDGLVLDVDGGSKEAKARIIVFKKHGGTNQKFRIVPVNKIK